MCVAQSDVVSGLETIKQNDNNVAGDLVRLEAEAAGVKALMDRRRSEMAARGGKYVS